MSTFTARQSSLLSACPSSPYLRNSGWCRHAKLLAFTVSSPVRCVYVCVWGGELKGDWLCTDLMTKPRGLSWPSLLLPSFLSSLPLAHLLPPPDLGRRLLSARIPPVHSLLFFTFLHCCDIMQGETNKQRLFRIVPQPVFSFSLSFISGLCPWDGAAHIQDGLPLSVKLKDMIQDV